MLLYTTGAGHSETHRKQPEFINPPADSSMGEAYRRLSFPIIVGIFDRLEDTGELVKSKKQFMSHYTLKR